MKKLFPALFLSGALLSSNTFAQQNLQSKSLFENTPVTAEANRLGTTLAETRAMITIPKGATLRLEAPSIANKELPQPASASNQAGAGSILFTLSNDTLFYPGAFIYSSATGLSANAKAARVALKAAISRKGYDLGTTLNLEQGSLYGISPNNTTFKVTQNLLANAWLNMYNSKLSDGILATGNTFLLSIDPAKLANIVAAAKAINRTWGEWGVAPGVTASALNATEVLKSSPGNRFYPLRVTSGKVVLEPAGTGPEDLIKTLSGVISTINSKPAKNSSNKAVNLMGQKKIAITSSFKTEPSYLFPLLMGKFEELTFSRQFLQNEIDYFRSLDVAIKPNKDFTFVFPKIDGAHRFFITASVQVQTTNNTPIEQARQVAPGQLHALLNLTISLVKKDNTAQINKNLQEIESALNANQALQKFSLNTNTNLLELEAQARKNTLDDGKIPLPTLALNPRPPSQSEQRPSLRPSQTNNTPSNEQPSNFAYFVNESFSNKQEMHMLPKGARIRIEQFLNGKPLAAEETNTTGSRLFTFSHDTPFQAQSIVSNSLPVVPKPELAPNAPRIELGGFVVRNNAFERVTTNLVDRGLFGSQNALPVISESQARDNINKITSNEKAEGILAVAHFFTQPSMTTAANMIIAAKAANEAWGNKPLISGKKYSYLDGIGILDPKNEMQYYPSYSLYNGQVYDGNRAGGACNTGMIIRTAFSNFIYSINSGYLSSFKLANTTINTTGFKHSTQLYKGLGGANFLDASVWYDNERLRDGKYIPVQDMTFQVTNIPNGTQVYLHSMVQIEEIKPGTLASADPSARKNSPLYSLVTVVLSTKPLDPKYNQYLNNLLEGLNKNEKLRALKGKEFFKQSIANGKGEKP